MHDAHSPSTAAPRRVPLAEALAVARAGAVLDVRGEAAFRAGHLAGSGHVPLDELGARRAELPPRGTPVLVLADDPPAAARAAEALAHAGFAAVAWLDAPLAAMEGGRASTAPPARLWRPAPFLERALPLLPRGGKAADLAAGAGRDAVFLALHGFEVEAWDRDAEALGRAAELAARHGVAVRTVRVDLEAPGATLPESRYDVIACFRFLHRPLFPAMAAALAPGGVIVIETFRVGQERFGKPRRPRFLLEPGELLAAFAGLEVLRHEEPSPEGGPWTSGIVARRPPIG